MNESRLAERVAVIAYLLDRAEQYRPSSGYQTFVDELVTAIGMGEHVDKYRAGEYDDLKDRVMHFVMKASK